MSGGGKSSALKMLEDMGFYCVDNLPVSLLDKFLELVSMPGSDISKVALGLDVRTDQSFRDTTQALEKLRQSGYPIEILFMDASEEVLIKRYKETRRLHPLALEGRVEDGVAREKKILEKVRREANFVIDTSTLLTRELKEELDRIFMQDKEYNSLMVTVMSFGFKYGLPQDADLIFDVRFLPNPYYIDRLKQKTGLDQEVADYCMAFTEAEEFMEKLTDMLDFLIPYYAKEGKYRLIVAIGCTGGKHRSVTLAGELYQRMNNQGNYGMKLLHRDVHR
jgi:UPF0042 nucleotide-binding protein